jgi:hypothetical protein
MFKPQSAASLHNVAAEHPAEFGSSARALQLAARFGPPRRSQQVGTYSVIGKEVLQLRLIRGLKGQVDQAGAAEGVHLAGGDASEFLTKTHVAQSHLREVQGTDGLWRFLRDKRNQQVLGWLGGGLVVAQHALSRHPDL